MRLQNGRVVDAVAAAPRSFFTLLVSQKGATNAIHSNRAWVTKKPRQKRGKVRDDSAIYNLAAVAHFAARLHVTGSLAALVLHFNFTIMDNRRTAWGVIDFGALTGL